jgi:GcrA cell cycle regulator
MDSNYAGDCLSDSPWKDEAKVELLKELLPMGLSAQQMAARIGGVSRNAVIGKIHRLGLAGSPDRQVLRKKRQRSRAERTHQKRWRRPMSMRQNRVAELFDAEPLGPTEPEVFIPENERKRSIVDLADIGECKWPIGDPRHADFHFCARKQVSGLSYCEFHARRAYQPPVPRQYRQAAPAHSVSTNASLEEVG